MAKSIDMKTTKELAKEYADRCQFLSDFPHDWNSDYSGYIAGYNEAMRWRDPKEAPQNTDMLVKYTIVGDIFDYTCLEKDCDDTWHWRGEEWDVNKYPIIGWRPIE